MKKQLVLAAIILLIGSNFVAGFAQAIPTQLISSPVIIATPTPTPMPTSPPAPTPSPTPIPNVSLDYEELSRTTEGEETVVTLQVTATYNFGEAMTYDYQNFVLEIRTSRGGLEPFPIYLLTGTAKPFETGSVTVGSSNTYATFTLTFRFSTIQNSFGGAIPFAYELVYNSNTISSSTPEPTIFPSASPTPIASSIATSTETPTSTPNQIWGNPSVFGLDFNWLEVALVVAVGVVVALLVVVIALQGKRIRVLEMKQNSV